MYSLQLLAHNPRLHPAKYFSMYGTATAAVLIQLLIFRLHTSEEIRIFRVPERNSAYESLIARKTRIKQAREID